MDTSEPNPELRGAEWEPAPPGKLKGYLQNLPYAESVACVYAMVAKGAQLVPRQEATVWPSIESQPEREVMEDLGIGSYSTMQRPFGNMAKVLDDHDWERFGTRAAKAEFEAQQLIDDLRHLSPARRARLVEELLANSLPARYPYEWRETVQLTQVDHNTAVQLASETGVSTGRLQYYTRLGYRQLVRYAPPGFTERVHNALALEALAATYEPGTLREVLQCMNDEERWEAVETAMTQAHEEEHITDFHTELLTLRYHNGLSQRKVRANHFPEFSVHKISFQEDNALRSLLPFMDEAVLHRVAIAMAPTSPNPPSRKELRVILRQLPPAICHYMLESLAVRSHARTRNNLVLAQEVFAQSKHGEQGEEEVRKTSPGAISDLSEALGFYVKAWNVTDDAVVRTFSGQNDDYTLEDYLRVATGEAHRVDTIGAEHDATHAEKQEQSPVRPAERLQSLVCQLPCNDYWIAVGDATLSLGQEALFGQLCEGRSMDAIAMEWGLSVEAVEAMSHHVLTTLARQHDQASWTDMERRVGAMRWEAATLSRSLSILPPEQCRPLLIRLLESAGRFDKKSYDALYWRHIDGHSPETIAGWQEADLATVQARIDHAIFELARYITPESTAAIETAVREQILVLCDRPYMGPDELDYVRCRLVEGMSRYQAEHVVILDMRTFRQLERDISPWLAKTNK